MATFNDGSGNHYIGDCLYGNHDINYPAINYLKSRNPETDNIATDLASIMSTLGASHTLVNDFVSATTTFDVSFAGDPAPPTSKRFNMSLTSIRMTNNTRRDNDAVAANTGQLDAKEESYFSASTGVPINEKQIVGHFSSTNYAWFTSRRVNSYTEAGADNSYMFWYGGVLESVNPNFNYYDATYANTCIVLAGGLNVASNAFGLGYHYLTQTSANKAFLQSGDAQYAISCTDAQVPSGNWATELYVFDDNADLGYPAIGKVKNMLVATGTYTLGKPVKLDTPVGSGFNRWLPVGVFAGKTLLMRCYSSNP